ncbi:unnamed protein product [Zymoseptoria tritici ST99CH_3D1]|nr:unnamed protein product [Zymoseptoria tritici ST99CH_3D1]
MVLTSMLRVKTIWIDFINNTTRLTKISFGAVHENHEAVPIRAHTTSAVTTSPTDVNVKCCSKQSASCWTIPTALTSSVPLRSTMIHKSTMTTAHTDGMEDKDEMVTS